MQICGFFVDGEGLVMVDLDRLVENGWEEEDYDLVGGIWELGRVK